MVPAAHRPQPRLHKVQSSITKIEKVRVWSQLPTDLSPENTECKEREKSVRVWSQPPTDLSPENTECNERENSVRVWSQPPTDLIPEYTKYKVH